jgi:multidrug resistance efflux pump
MITTAELGTKNAKAAVEDQSDELDQLKKMYKTEELTNATADIVTKRAVRNLELSKITADMAEQHEQKVKQFDYDRDRSKGVLAIEQQTNALDQLKATQALSAVTRKTALDSARESVDKAQKKLDDLKSDLSSFSVKASFDGIVSYGELTSGTWQNSGLKALRVGDKVNSGQVVMTLFAPGKLRVIAPIEESQSLWVHAGDKARIVPRNDPGATTEGVCAALPAVVEKDSFDLPVEPAKIDPSLSPGEKASVQIDLPEVKDVLIVASDVVHHGRVKVKAGEREEWRDVVIGVSDDKNTEIKSGLNEGDTLAKEEK